ncbi:Poly [ADP-ribose] polymerase [Gryllus bimaculatus]|nr:Poly [ADP-ribose] polymerase [Gryllus bimaculatus]
MSENADDLPYRAEYSKSGRASCRGCKNQIAKETLRLAVLVQSPMFDGKVPHWYHFMCFFGKQRPKTTGDIAHFESLRWEDQEKIKKKIEVRVSKKDYESDIGKRYGGQDLWHHVDCFSKLRATLEYWESGSALPGFKTLTKDDQKMVESKLPKIQPIKKEETDEADGPSEPKKAKEDPDVEKRKKQNKLMFKFRDNLKKHLSKKELSLLLEHNNQEIPSGEERMLDRLSDIMTFGALQPCEQCKDGQFTFRSGVGYQCQGDLTEWTKCLNTVEEPKRKPFKVPRELADEYDFLAKYKFVSQGKRLFDKVEPSTSKVKKEDEDAGPKVYRPPPPLQGMEFVIGSGIKKDERKKIKERVAKLGGKIVSKVHATLAAVIAPKDDVEKMGSIISEAEQFDIQVVPEDFLDEVEKTPAVDVIAKKNLADWGSDVKGRIPETKSVPKKSKSGSMFTKSMPSKVKLRLKGGNAVDPDTGLENIAHVYQKDKDIYNVVLGVTDIQSGKNSFYKLQLLQADNGNRFWCFRAWGRIGTTIGGNKLNEGTLNEMLQEFKTVYEEKTGNMWEDRHHFVKVPGKMYPVDVDYSDGNDEALNDMTSDVPSKLQKPVQELIKLMFDVNAMKKVMQEFELDLEKMPLGKLSKRQLQHALQVLTDLQELVKNNASHSQFVDASNRFYTLIPHDFGVDVPPVINTEDMIKQKLEMVESLMEMEVAYSLLKTSTSDSKGDAHILDSHYEKLKTDIEIVEKDSEEFVLLQNYVKNTHGATHTSYELEILEYLFSNLFHYMSNMYERHAADYIEKLPKNHHSCKGLGRTEPDPKAAVVRPDGVEIPLGKGVPVKKGNNLSLYYNEYIVYDVAQGISVYELDLNVS